MLNKMKDQIMLFSNSIWPVFIINIAVNLSTSDALHVIDKLSNCLIIQHEM